VSNKLYLIISGSIFLLVVISLLLKLLYRWPIIVGTWTIPHALSYVGFPAAAGYAVWTYWLWRN
jgi:hypothetical protein